MRNYRVVLDKKEDKFYVQGQARLTKIWLPITKHKKGDYLLNVKSYIHYVAVFAALFLNYFVSESVTILGVLAVSYDIFFIIYAGIWLIELRQTVLIKDIFIMRILR